MFKILELYSGIGGMHCAWNESGLSGQVIAAVDINTVANDVYQYNFPNTDLINKNIQALKPEEINKMDINVILMSPPCQPFTRNGKFLDKNDARTDSFIYLIEILDQLENLQYLLMENVKGFEGSVVRDLFIEKLKACNFEYQECLLSPTCVGIPNSRLRYYCIARRSQSTWHFKRKDGLEFMNSLLTEYVHPYSIENIVEDGELNTFLLPEKMLKRGNILDICYKQSTRSCCFTKAYSHYVEGTGSVFTESSPEKVKEFYKQANLFEVGSKEFIESLKKLKLRFFTPTEILSLMSFPKHYKFPESTTIKQQYRLLGNSVNVKVISELLKLLFN